MSCDLAIQARALAKCYQLYERPQDRLWQFLWRGRRQYFRAFHALHALDLSVARGEVVGVIGRNGSGKSTLLQLICGTLTPSSGQLNVYGRVAALLELGAGFNPEFSGRENVYLNAAILGLTHEQIAARFEDIVDFSGVRDFIDQPVKTYSSGMFMRLAFAVAVHVDPDILVIDEALSVGDGEFARKSFERIMALKDAGKTILFCSHSMYQVEAICNRVIWLREGALVMQGAPAEVVSAYNDYLAGLNPLALPHGVPLAAGDGQAGAAPEAAPDLARAAPRGTARLSQVEAWLDEQPPERELCGTCARNTLSIRVLFASDPAIPAPSVAVCLMHHSGLTVASAGTRNDGLTLSRDAQGNGMATLVLPQLPLLKGEYEVDVYLMCERGIHVYEHAMQVARLSMRQQGLELGLVSLPHHWESPGSVATAAQDGR